LTLKIQIKVVIVGPTNNWAAAMRDPNRCFFEWTDGINLAAYQGGEDYQYRYFKEVVHVVAG